MRCLYRMLYIEGENMNKEIVIDAINLVRKYKSETSTIEIKSAAKGFPRRCYDTFFSFSNRNGGLIIFGLLEEKGFATEGVYDINDLQKQIASLCNDSMEPKIRVEILPIEFESKNILAVKVSGLAQNKKPCYYKPKGLKSGSYIRVGESDEVMTDYEIYVLQSYNDHIIEDKRPNKSSTIDDLNINDLKEYINKIKSDRPNFAKNSFKENLKLCGIVDSDNTNIYPTLAGTMIFGKYPQSYYPQLFVACVVVPGTKLGDTGSMGERFIDNKRIEGTIEEMLEGTMNFLRRNMKTSVIIDENGKRINRTEYPIEALREAVANALIHRDYSFKTENAYSSVYMYEDRIEILSPGALYGPNKIEKLGTDNMMEVRNPTIVRILEGKGSVIENRHSGIPTMKREMGNYNLPMPEFYNERGSFKVIFRNSFDLSSEQVSMQVGDQNSMQVSEQASTNKSINSTVSEQVSVQVEGQNSMQVSEQVSVQVSEQVSTFIFKYKELLEYCKTPKSAKEIRDYLQLKSRNYVNNKILKPLIRLNLLEYTNKQKINSSNQKYITKIR